ncbi:MAG TPA: hypothetical protein VKB92_17230 [Myxococcales bacterium]|nr:hypothetical protein [Myxococcales bacterium]
MRFALKFSVAGALLLAGTAALAQEPAPYQSARTGFDGTYQRHFGFYIRPDLGFGYMSMAGPGGTVYGLSGLGGIAIGGAIRENSILAVHFIDSVAQDPSVSGSGFSGTATGSSLTMFGIGPQYTYYFMPANVYLSTTLALTRLHVSDPAGDFNSDWGLGTRVAVGKEWWVSDHWGLGLAGHFSLSSNQNGAGDALTTWALGVVFSTTYN